MPCPLVFMSTHTQNRFSFIQNTASRELPLYNAASKRVRQFNIRTRLRGHRVSSVLSYAKHLQDVRYVVNSQTSEIQNADPTNLSINYINIYVATHYCVDGPTRSLTISLASTLLSHRVDAERRKLLAMLQVLGNHPAPKDLHLPDPSHRRRSGHP